MDSDGDLATVARETFEYGIVTWAGRNYEEWVRAWARPPPLDPRGLVQVPPIIYDAFKQRAPGQRLNSKQAAALGYRERRLDRCHRRHHKALCKEV